MKQLDFSTLGKLKRSSLNRPDRSESLGQGWALKTLRSWKSLQVTDFENRTQMLRKLLGICYTWQCHIDRMSRYHVILGYGKLIISDTNASRETYLEMQLLG